MVRYLVIAILVVSLGSAGCSSKRVLGKSSGQVTFQGAAVPEGMIVFEDSSQGLTYVSDLESDGSFAFQVAGGNGLPPGNYQVAIQPPRSSKPSLTYIPAQYRAKSEFPNIPEKYHDIKTSPFRAEIKAGQNEPMLFAMNPD